MEEWLAQRNAAQVILGAYGSSVVQALPDAVRHFLEGMPATEERDVYIARLAGYLDNFMHNQVDPLTSASMAYPMGKDLVIASVAANATTKEHIREETDLCIKATYVLTEVAKNKSCRRHEKDTLTNISMDAVDASSSSSVQHKQVVLPMVFGAKYPLTARDVDAVNEHFPEKEDRCMKSIAAFSAAAGSNDEPRLVLSPLVCMSVELLHARLVEVSSEIPALLLRALSELGLLGPAFFRGRIFLPDGVLYPFGGRTLVLAYAEWLQRHVERTIKKN